MLIGIIWHAHQWLDQSHFLYSSASRSKQTVLVLVAWPPFVIHLKYYICLEVESYGKIDHKRKGVSGLNQSHSLRSIVFWEKSSACTTQVGVTVYLSYKHWRAFRTQELHNEFSWTLLSSLHSMPECHERSNAWRSQYKNASSGCSTRSLEPLDSQHHRPILDHIRH